MAAKVLTVGFEARAAGPEDDPALAFPVALEVLIFKRAVWVVVCDGAAGAAHPAATLGAAAAAVPLAFPPHFATTSLLETPSHTVPVAASRPGVGVAPPPVSGGQLEGDSPQLNFAKAAAARLVRRLATDKAAAETLGFTQGTVVVSCGVGLAPSPQRSGPPPTALFDEPTFAAAVVQHAVKLLRGA